MMYANIAGALVPPSLESRRATCPTCDAPVIAKTGQINVWHWAHESGRDCDEWAEPDSVWHHTWEQRFPRSLREVTMGPHRADIADPGTRTILELQHSHLSVDTISERERFYQRRGRMVWLWDATRAVGCHRLLLRIKDGAPRNLRTFRWKHARKSIAACRCEVYLDLGSPWILNLRRLHPTAPVGGWGYLLTYGDFIASLTGQANVRTAA